MPPFAEAMAGDRRYFLAHGIESVHVLMWPKGYWWNHSLNGVLAGRCFYDAALDPYQAIRDHALHYFGEKVDQMSGFRCVNGSWSGSWSQARFSSAAGT